MSRTGTGTAPRTDRSSRRPRPPVTAMVSAGSLVTGFAVAELTGVRALGGVVLLLGGGAAAARWWRRSGPGTAVGLSALFVGAFAGSHVLARGLGAWPSVLTVSAVTGVAAWLASDRRPDRRAGGRPDRRPVR